MLRPARHVEGDLPLRLHEGFTAEPADLRGGDGVHREAVYPRDHPRPYRRGSQRLALAHEIEVDLEANRIGHAEQHRHARLLHLDVIEGERRGSRSRHSAVLKLRRSFPDGWARHTTDREIPGHLERTAAGRWKWKRDPAHRRRNQYDLRIAVGFEQPSAHVAIATPLVAHERSRVQDELR